MCVYTWIIFLIYVIFIADENHFHEISSQTYNQDRRLVEITNQRFQRETSSQDANEYVIDLNGTPSKYEFK